MALPFKTMSTKNVGADEPSKTLLIAHHGFGKTTQCKNYATRYGPGLILSGEAGLKSLADTDIPYLPFTSWDGRHDPNAEVYSFRGIVRMLTPEVVKELKWIAIDSLTEMSDRLLEFLEEKHKGSNNVFELWGDYEKMMIGSLKWVRDLPVHVLVTCLAKEEEDDQKNVTYSPSLKGKGVAKKVPALFDHVLCGVRVTEIDTTGQPRIRRMILTEEVKGWRGKVRDPRKRIRPVEKGDDITELFARMQLSDEDWKKFQATAAASAPTLKAS